jgi:hypothetical protein
MYEAGSPGLAKGGDRTSVKDDTAEAGEAGYATTGLRKVAAIVFCTNL